MHNEGTEYISQLLGGKKKKKRRREMGRNAVGKYTSLRSEDFSSHFFPVLPIKGVPGEETSYLPHAATPAIRQLRSFSQ